MALIESQFGPARGAFNNYCPSPTSTIHAYTNTSDTVATIAASGYFNAISSFVQVGDAIYVQGSDAVHFYQVTAVSPNVTVTQIDDYAPALSENHIFVGDALGVPTDVAMSGDATILASGALTIANSAITNAKVSASAAIAFSKLAALTSGNILVGSAGTVPTSVALSGDVTLVASGAATIANLAVTTAKINTGAVTLAKLASGITPSHIIVYAGEVSNGGGSATITISVPGLLSTDVGFGQLSASTNAVTVQKVTTTADTITVLLSGDPGAATVLAYQALRPAA